jgi:DNA polymerase-4
MPKNKLYDPPTMWSTFSYGSEFLVLAKQGLYSSTADLVDNMMGKPPGRMNTQSRPKAIIHLDMDSFYPSVEVLDNPQLKHKPVIVGGSKERGVVSSASYEARKFGIRSAQPMATAMRLCPHGIFLPVRMHRYREMSNRVFKIFRLFTPLVEPVSIDEAFLDVTASTRLFGQPDDIAKKIKDIVEKETGLTVSAGVAPSKFVAKIASDIDKPDGLTVVASDRIWEFLEPLPIEKMWGVGKKTRDRLHRLGIRTIGHFAHFPAEVLKRNFGKHGVRMRELALGMDERDVIPVSDAKSVGHEKTFPQDILDTDSAKKEILSLADKVAHRMRRDGVTGKTLTLKVKFSDFVQVTRSTTLAESTDNGLEIYSTACRLLEKTEADTRPFRLLGVSVSQLIHRGSGEQLSLFHKGEASLRRKKLNTALDSVSEKFGEHSIRPATLLDK